MGILGRLAGHSNMERLCFSEADNYQRQTNFSDEIAKIRGNSRVLAIELPPGAAFTPVLLSRRTGPEMLTRLLKPPLLEKDLPQEEMGLTVVRSS